MSLRPWTLLCAALATMLSSCDSDPLYVIGNGRGMQIVDSLSGWNEDSRSICVRPERSPAACSSLSAEVYFRDVRHSGQVQAEWRNDHPQIVDVYVFGGTIDH